MDVRRRHDDGSDHRRFRCARPGGAHP
jgi:hypothetical protein